jgi:hypothetical protein
MAEPPDDSGPNDAGSTLVHRGKSALTYTEMASFVRDIEQRPLSRLLSDLPGLMVLPDLKYQLVVMVLRKKVKEGSADREPILERVRALQAGADDPTVRKRAEAFLAKPYE